MKRLITRSIAAILTLALLLTVAVIPAAHADDYATAVVKGGWLRLRDGATTDAKTISAYFTGTTVTILGGSGAWYHVLTPDGKTGYMHSGYLTITGSITGGQLAENTAATVTSSNGKTVRLRSGPSTQYSIIASYAVGTPLTVLTTGDTWCKVRINGRTGYMMTEFIKTDAGSNGSVAGGYTAYVVSGNGKGVVLRSGPAKSYDVLATYNVGQMVTVISYGSTWCQVSINGLGGYMMSEFLSTVKPENTGSTSGSASSYSAYVTSQNGKGVRMRMGASKIFPTIATYSVGTKVTVLEYGKEWCKIRIGSNTGYMMTEFLTTSPASSVVTAVKVSAASADPGDTLYTQVTPSDASVTYEWFNDKGVQVGTGSSYTIKESDLGRKIRVCVTGVSGTTGTAVSGWTTVQNYVSLVYQLKEITISDTTPTVGQNLTATLKPAGATATISWFRENGVLVGSGSTYTVRSSDVGYKLYAWADGTDQTTGDVTSAHTAAVTEAASATIVLQSVAISDTTPTVGDTLTATLSPGNASAAFTWRSSAGHILGYGSSYKVTENDVGSSIYVYANGTGTTSGSVVSNLTSPVQAAVSTTVRIDGVTLNDLSPTVGQTLYVTLEPQNASATFTWYRDDDKILSTNAYYTVQAEDLGHSLYVWVQGTNGTFGSATSKITSPVTN